MGGLLLCICSDSSISGDLGGVVEAPYRTRIVGVGGVIPFRGYILNCVAENRRSSAAYIVAFLALLDRWSLIGICGLPWRHFAPDKPSVVWAYPGLGSSNYRALADARLRAVAFRAALRERRGLLL